MRFFRAQRVEALIQEELSKIIIREVEFRNALPTITFVDVDKKMERAKIMVSVIPSSASNRVLRVLNEHIGDLQHLLMKKINIKPMPRIMFVIDRGAENAALVEKIALSDPESFEGKEEEKELENE
jgi:ribosome-binding factor A